MTLSTRTARVLLGAVALGAWALHVPALAVGVLVGTLAFDVAQLARDAWSEVERIGWWP